MDTSTTTESQISDDKQPTFSFFIDGKPLTVKSPMMRFMTSEPIFFDYEQPGSVVVDVNIEKTINEKIE